MTHVVKYKLYPGPNDPYLPFCYANAWNKVCDASIGAGYSALARNRMKLWKEMTGTELEMTDKLFIVTFASEADESLFALRWS